MALFDVGDVVATPSALQALDRSSQSPGELLTRHRRGEWGDLDAHDADANRAAVQCGERILSSYRTRLGEVLWVITEADRSSTCLLTPDEY